MRGNHDHEVVRKGLRYRQKGPDGFERDMERERERDREVSNRRNNRENDKEVQNRRILKEKEQEKEREKERERIKERDKLLGNSTSANGNMTEREREAGRDRDRLRSSSNQEFGGPKSSPNIRVQQHLELGKTILHLSIILLTGQGSADLSHFIMLETDISFHLCFS